jgi:hypothetical protein
MTTMPPSVLEGLAGPYPAVVVHNLDAELQARLGVGESP